MTLRIATYNIHRCIGRDGIEAPERIAAVLRDINADVMALQEVSFNNDGPNDILANLARATDAQAIAGPTLLGTKGPLRECNPFTDCPGQRRPHGYQCAGQGTERRHFDQVAI